LPHPISTHLLLQTIPPTSYRWRAQQSLRLASPIQPQSYRLLLNSLRSHAAIVAIRVARLTFATQYLDVEPVLRHRHLGFREHLSPPRSLSQLSQSPDCPDELIAAPVPLLKSESQILNFQSLLLPPLPVYRPSTFPSYRKQSP